MPPPFVEFLRRRGRWLTGVALLALAPKCLLCLAAYAGLGAALGLGGPELCGAPDDTRSGATGTFFCLTFILISLLVVLTRHWLRRPPSSQAPALR